VVLARLAKREIDPLDDPAFVPCREERCTIPTLHRAHANVGAGRQIKRCPLCNVRLVREPFKWAKCPRCTDNLNNP
jgi:hypothetical protein